MTLLKTLLTALGLTSANSGPATTVTSIADITGDRYLSPLNGTGVQNVAGLVTAKGPNGFWIRVYVFGRDANGNVTIGDLIAIDGNITEFRSNKDYVYLTEIINPTNIRVTSSGNEIKAVVIGEKTSGIIGKRNLQPPREQFSRLDDGDVFAVPNNESLISVVNPRLEPSKYGMDFWESLSGELVTIKGVTALGHQANNFGDQWVRGNWKVSGKNSQGGLTVTNRDSNPETIIIGAPLDGSKNSNETKLGDELEDITGIVQYAFGFYALFPTTGTQVKRSIDAFPPPSTISSNGKCSGLTFGTYNIENYSPNASHTELLSEHIVDFLNTPSVLFVQEVQDSSGSLNDGVTNANLSLASLASAISDISNVDYLWVNVDPVNNQDGGAPGGNIQTAYLYNPLEVRLRDPNPGSSTDRNEVVDGPALRYNPGRIDDGETFANSRKPLVAHWETVDGSGTFFTVNNHWTSKGGSTSLQGDPRPPVNNGVEKRTRQAEVTGAFIAEILKQDKNAAVIAAGDFNEFAMVETLRRFVEVSGLKDLDVVAKVPEAERYTYTFGASQQQLDHMYASSWATRNMRKGDFQHIHANTWVSAVDEASDHDPSVAKLNVCTR
ncbi:hypothetical protein Q7P37_007888 [Cladosporium fusiforme]